MSNRRMSDPRSDRDPAAFMDKSCSKNEREAAFNEWLTSVEPEKVRGFLGQSFKGHDDQSLDDLVQDALVVAYNKVSDGKYEYRSQSSFTAFVTRIAKNAAIDAIRRNARLLSLEEREEKGGSFPSSLDEIEALEAELTCETVLAEMSKEDRVLFIQHEVYDMSFSELAHDYNLSEEALKKRLQRKKQSIRSRLGL